MHGLQLVGSVHGTGPAPGCLRKGTISYIRGAHGGAQGGWRTIPYLAVNEKRPMFQGLLGAGNRIRTGDVQLGKLSTRHPCPTLTSCNHSNKDAWPPETAETRKPAHSARCKQAQATKQCPKQCPPIWQPRGRRHPSSWRHPTSLRAVGR